MAIVEQQIKGQQNAKKLLELGCKENMPMLLIGDTGTGKTSLIRELAADHGKEYVRFSITGETTVDDFVGKYVLRDGETIWQDGILLTAAQQGAYLVVDEINAALPEILFVLHALLDDDKYIIVPQKDGEKIVPHKDFRFFATMNPVDEYAGTKELNKAFQSRFAMILEINYPSRDIEVEVLMNRTGVEENTAQRMIDVAIGIRRAKADDQLFYTCSTRDLLYWGQLERKIGIHPAFIVAILNKAMPDREMIEKIYKNVFKEYQQLAKDKVETNFEWFKSEWKKLDAAKQDVRPLVRKELEDELQTDRDAITRDRSILERMEERLKEEIKKGLKAA